MSLEISVSASILVVHWLIPCFLAGLLGSSSLADIDRGFDKKKSPLGMCSPRLKAIIAFDETMGLCLWNRTLYVSCES